MARNIVIYLGAMVMPEGNAGAQRTVSLCKSFIDVGYKPVVIGLTKEDVSKNIIETRKHYQSIDYYEIKYPTTIQDWVHRMLEIERFIDVINYYGVDNIHSIIAIDYEMIALSRLQRFCQKNEIHLIADSMEWYERSSLPFPMNVVKDIDTFVRMRILYKKMNNAICISKYLYEYHKSINPQKNAVVIPVTVDKKDQKWNCDAVDSHNEVRTLVYCGNPGDSFIKERLDWIVDIVMDLNRRNVKCMLKVIGVSREWFVSQTKNKMQADGYEWMDQCVRFMGATGHRECIREIQNSDFFTIAREDRLVTRAGFPTKLSEGLACGIPVVTTPTSDISYYLEGRDFAFISDGFTYESFYKVIEQAVSVTEEDLRLLKEHAYQYMGLDYRSFTKDLELFMRSMKA